MTAYLLELPLAWFNNVPLICCFQTAVAFARVQIKSGNAFFSLMACLYQTLLVNTKPGNRIKDIHFGHTYSPQTYNYITTLVKVPMK